MTIVQTNMKSDLISISRLYYRNLDNSMEFHVREGYPLSYILPVQKV
jgi:hypothetical protein